MMSGSDSAFPVLVSTSKTYDVQQAGSIKASTVDGDNSFPRLLSTETSFYLDMTKASIARQQSNSFSEKKQVSTICYSFCH